MNTQNSQDNSPDWRGITPSPRPLNAPTGAFFSELGEHVLSVVCVLAFIAFLCIENKIIGA